MKPALGPTKNRLYSGWVGLLEIIKTKYIEISKIKGWCS